MVEQLSGPKAVLITVEGRVQGVGFRYWTRFLAQKMTISGWVRNKQNGDVEIHAEGQVAELHCFIDRLYEGPPSAMVTRVNTFWYEEESGFTDFSIKS